MCPPPRSPHWRPGPPPGAGGRETGLGLHHHHQGLRHPTHSQRRPGTWKGQRGCEDGPGWGVSLNPPSSKRQGRPPAGQSDKEEGGQEGRERQSSQSKSQKDRGHSSHGLLSPAPSLPSPCLLRGEICSRFASSRTSSELSAPSSGQPRQFSQPPSCITYSCEPVWELSLCFVSAPRVTGRDACVSPSARQALPGVQRSLWAVHSMGRSAWHGQRRCCREQPLLPPPGLRRGAPGRGARELAPCALGSSPWETPLCGSWPSALPPARQSPWLGPEPPGAGAPSGSCRSAGGYRSFWSLDSLRRTAC